MTSVSNATTEYEVELVRLTSLEPATLNDAVYKPVDSSDPAVRELADSVRRNGVLEPIVVTQDDVIVSGHRRRVACQLAGVRVVPVRRLAIESTDPNFSTFLVEFNRSREKTTAEKVREAMVGVNPAEAHAELKRHRRAESDKVNGRVTDAGLSVIATTQARRRSNISSAKRPMLDAVLQVLEELDKFLPVTLRQIHYRLLNDPPPRNANAPRKRYANDRASYSDLSDLLTRARLTGEVPWDSVHDPTRPNKQWRVWAEPGAFAREHRDDFLRGYYRDLLQSQPAYVEVVGEKMTVQSIAEGVASDFCVPVCIGRGYSSIEARHQIAERFRRSGKDRLTLLVLSDLDPEGENIGETLAASLRDEFDVPAITAVKVALTHAQVREHRLPAVMTAKATSSRAKGYTAKHGSAVYELEALPPDVLQAEIRRAIESVLDMNLFRAEEDREQADAAELAAIRQVVAASLVGALPD
jgi:hypothetical protein